MENKTLRKYLEVKTSIDSKLRELGRPSGSVQLIAVTKTHPTEVIEELYSGARSAGIDIVIGENYVQEFKEKRDQLPPDLQCHFIGHLQRNKAKDAARLFSVIESVDSAALADALNKEAGKSGKVQEIYLQVNISNDPGKGGFSPSDTATFLAKNSSSLTSLKITGLMTITAFYDDPELARPDFKAMRALRDSLPLMKDGKPLALSMGMSSDYLVAIEEGATVVRVGTAIFGSRQNS